MEMQVDAHLDIPMAGHQHTSLTASIYVCKGLAVVQLVHQLDHKVREQCAAR